MPKVTNKSARIFHFDNGMCGPGQEAQLGDEEFNKPVIQGYLESTDLVEDRDAKRIQAAEQKAEEQKQKAQEQVQKAEEQARKAHEQAAQKR